MSPKSEGPAASREAGEATGVLRPSTSSASNNRPQSRRLAEFWRDRGGNSVRVSLLEFEGRRRFIDVRQHFTAPSGILQPTTKGVTIPLHRLPDLARAVNKALAEVRRRGLFANEVGER
jgi:hypothetical protein